MTHARGAARAPSCDAADEPLMSQPNHASVRGAVAVGSPSNSLADSRVSIGSRLTHLTDGRDDVRRRTLRVHSFLRGTRMASNKNTNTLAELSSQLSAAVEQ